MLRIPLPLPFIGALLLVAAPAAAQVRWAVDVESRVAVPSSIVAVAADGSIYAARGDSVVRISRGGRAGRNLGVRVPGLRTLGIRGDTLAAVGRGTIVRLITSGTLLRTAALPTQPTAPGFGPPVPTGALADGSLLVVPTFDLGQAVTGAIGSVPIQRIDPAGRVLGTPGTQSLRTFGMRIHGPAGRTVHTRQPWSDEALIAVSPAGDWFAIVERPLAGERGTARLHVARTRADGVQVWRRPVEVPNVPLSPAAVARAEALYAEGFLGEVTPDTRRAVRSALAAPRFLPPATNAVATSDGRLWIRGAAAFYDDPAVVWTVLDPDGEVAGTLEIPGRWLLVEARGNRVWAVERSTNGTGTLLVLRLREGGR